MNKTLTLIQEVYVDMCDILDGNTYKDIGYDNKKDFLLAQKEKLAEIENRYIDEVKE